MRHNCKLKTNHDQEESCFKSEELRRLLKRGVELTFKWSGRCLSRSRSGDLLVVLGVHVVDEVDDPVGISVLVVVPGDELDEGGRQLDAGLGVEDGRPVVGQEVGGDDLLVGVALKRKTKKHFSFLVMRNNQ